MPYDQNYIAIEFAAVGYNQPGQQTFEYRLEGIDPDWINPGKRRYASYTNLASGRNLPQNQLLQSV